MAFFIFMGKFIDLTGQKFDRLYVASYFGVVNKKSIYNVVCDCGNKILVESNNLKTGHTKSCGCLCKEINKNRMSTHKMSMDPIYKVYLSIKARCYNKKSHAYKHYGGRGIVMSDRWLNSFEDFLADMGPRPSPKYSIDRKDNNKGYTTENCRWATKSEQGRNTRCNIKVKNTTTGVIYDSIAEAAESVNMDYKIFWQLLKRNKTNKINMIII